jgi:hypothetical protein
MLDNFDWDLDAGWGFYEVDSINWSDISEIWCSFIAETLKTKILTKSKN